MTWDVRVATINRTAADGSDLGTWAISSRGDGAGMQCVTPDGTQLALRATSLLDAVTEVPDVFRLAPRVIHEVACLDAASHPADLAARMQEVTPDLDDFYWQDMDGWNYDRDCPVIGDVGSPALRGWLAGNLPLSINGLQLMPMRIADGPIQLLPFALSGHDGSYTDPCFITQLSSLTASNDWGSCGAPRSVSL